MEKIIFKYKDSNRDYWEIHCELYERDYEEGYDLWEYTLYSANSTELKYYFTWSNPLDQDHGAPHLGDAVFAISQRMSHLLLNFARNGE